MWNKQQMEAVDDAGAESTVAKFRDFKVFMDTNHVDDYIAAGDDLNATNLLPIAYADPLVGVPAALLGLVANGKPSQIVIPNDCYLMLLELR